MSQASAGIVSTNAEAQAFWLNDAQQAVLANEHGPDASPFYTGGAPLFYSHRLPAATHCFAHLQSAALFVSFC